MSVTDVTRMRLERLADERKRTEEKIGDILEVAEDETRDLAEYENEMLSKHRTHLSELEGEIDLLAGDLERAEGSRDVSQLLRGSEAGKTRERSTRGGQIVELGDDGPVVYRTFAAYARDAIISRYPLIASAAAGGGSAEDVRQAAQERLQRTVENTLTSDVQGLLPPQHMAQIMDIINGSRPVVVSSRHVDLSSGKLTYPKIGQRPEVLKQGTEKQEAGTAKMSVTLEDMTADTYLGAGDLSWQAINWSSPGALQLWFDLAAEAYARATETVACAALEAAGTAAIGTIANPLGTAGTESFNQWSAAVMGAISTIYATTGGRSRTDTLYLSADRFFALAGLTSDQVVSISPVGNLDISTMTGTYRGLRVVGSYGFQPATAIVGDASAFLVGETPGAPVEMRAVEPAIGGMEVGVIGAFAAKVFDVDRFEQLS